MKFRDIPVDTDFKFQGSNKVCRKLAQRKILTDKGIIFYHKNEEVRNTNDPDVPKWVDFRDVPNHFYFKFVNNPSTVYKKVSAYKIRQLGETKTRLYRKNEKTEVLGNDISQFIQPIELTINTAK